MDPKELKYKDRKYLENFVMKPMGIRSRSTQIQRIGIFTKDRASKERYQPIKVSLESVEAKSQFLLNFKVKRSIHQDHQKSQKKNEIEQNKSYKWRVTHSVGCTLKRSFVKI